MANRIPAQHEVSRGFLAGGACCTLGLIAAWMLRDCTWDDSAITLGYSRTFALEGEVRFGKYGPIVEGFSSPLWMFVGAAVSKLNSAPAAILANTQIVCGLLYVTNAWLLDKLAHRLRLDRAARLLLVALYALSAASITSVADAMENHAFLGLHLLVAIAWLRFKEFPTAVSAQLLGVTLACLAWCRPEGALTVGVFSIALLRLMRTLRGRSAILGICVSLTFVLVGVTTLLAWRWHTFDAFAPNTVAAKRWPPYSAEPLLKVVGGAKQIGHALLASLTPLLPLAGLVSAHRDLRAAIVKGLSVAAREQLALVACIAIQLSFFFVTGRIWGTDNRTALAVIPYIWLILLLASRGLDWRRIATQYARLTLSLSVAIFILLQAYYLRKYATNDVTVATVFRKTAPAVQLARLGKSTPWRIATPDVGAALLWWGQEIELVDTALLNERVSAREGWLALPGVLFNEHPPEALLVHTLWTKYGGFDRSPYVREHYRKVAINGDSCILLLKETLAELRRTMPSSSVSDATGASNDKTDVPIPVLVDLKLPPLAFQ